MKKDVALLNPPPVDAGCAADMVRMLREHLDVATRALTDKRCPTMDEYTAAFTRVEVLRRMVDAAETIYGAHFRV